MNPLTFIGSYCRNLVSGWNQFWFQAADPSSLCLIRILAGAMMFYTHLVWSIDLTGFFGSKARISTEFADAFADPFNAGSHFAWSHLPFVDSPTLLWAVHLFALLVFALLTLGLWSRAMAILAAALTIAYAHRAPGAQFGLDQINILLALYLCVGPCGAKYSLDRMFGSGSTEPPPKSVTANIAIRLIQCHLCVIYLFAGMSKLTGETWWEGTALWRSFANYEYQSVNMLWLAHVPWLINLLTHVALIWELSYAFLIWPKATRPLILAFAVFVHLGIAFCMGMITFGLVMIIANVAFVAPSVVDALVSRRGGATERLAERVSQ